MNSARILRNQTPEVHHVTATVSTRSGKLEGDDHGGLLILGTL
jgi:hypothetical protein